MAQGRAITTKQIEKVLDGLRHGMTRRAASAYGGMHRVTLQRAILADASLAAAVERAEDEGEAAHTLIVAEAGPKNWQASAWWLERRHPDDYGRRDRLDVKVDIKAVVSKIAAERGLDEADVMAEVEAILAEAG